MQLSSKTLLRSLLLFVLLLTACAPKATPTAEPKVWFGMQVSPDVWDTKEVEGTIFQRGLLTHRALAGCRVSILSTDPVTANGYNADWNNSFHQQFKTDKLQMDLYRIKDQAGNPRDTYFEVADITGQRGYPLYRLAYFVIEGGEKPSECVDATYALLNTLDPALFPDINTAQG